MNMEEDPMPEDRTGKQPTVAPAQCDDVDRPRFAGMDHVALTVTHLDISQRFYTQVLDFVVVMNVLGTGRICMHPQTGFVLALLTHDEGDGAPFSELNVGTDHLGFSATSREELQAWEARFKAYEVPHTPIRDELFASHLSFRDPDNIALEFSSSNDLMLAARGALSSGSTSAADIAAFIAKNVGPDFVASAQWAARPGHGV
jgi:catechol 2,3-dioxygenase-like lactoylglutathione lyase family enzyme